MHMLTEWQAFDGIEPIDSRWRGDLNAGILASIMANLWGKRSGSEPYKPRDFMPNFEPPQPKTAEEIYQSFRMWALMSGAGDKTQ